MKQRRHFAGVGIDASEIRPFVKVTFRAGEREIFGVVRAAMLPRNDMLNVKAKAGEVLGKAAILATGGRTGSSPHPSGGFGENGLGFSFEDAKERVDANERLQLFQLCRG